MEELTKKELLDYLEEISQQLNNIALDQIPFAISELYFKLENSISISLIEKKREELENVLDIIKTGKDEFSKGQASVLERIIKMFDKELLDERSNTDEQ